MSEFKEKIDQWADQLYPVFYKAAGAMPVIMSGTDPFTDAIAIREYSGSSIVWFYYPLNILKQNEWISFLLLHNDLEVLVSTTDVISRKFGLEEAPGAFLVYMEKRK